MKYLDRIKRNVVRLEDEDWPSLETFQAEIKKEDPDFRPFDQRYFYWTQDKNPHRGKNGPQLWVYRGGDGSIHGQQVGIPFSLSVEGKSYRASWAVNLMVSPSFRMRGIGNALSSIHQEDSDITLGIGISEEAYNAYLRAGWIDLGKMEVFIRPIDAHAMLPLFGLSSENFFYRCAAGLCNGFLRILDFNTKLIYRFLRGIRIEPIERFDPRVEQIWEKAKVHYPVLATRNFRSLKWRFDEAVESTCYQRFYVWKREKICGYFVLREGVRNGVRVTSVVDFLCPPPFVSSLMAGVLNVAHQGGAAALYCRLNLFGATKHLYPLGFCKRPSFTRIMAAPNESSELATILPKDPSAWFVTMADSDGDYFEEQELQTRTSMELAKIEAPSSASAKPKKLSAL